MENSKIAKGLNIRRAVLGDAHVDKSLTQADDFNQPMIDFVAEYCWGTIWERPGLSRRDRSLLNLGMLSALNRSDEMKVHVRGALRNGLTKDEIREALMQVAVYCGVPAGATAFRIAREVFKQLEDEQKGKG